MNLLNFWFTPSNPSLGASKDVGQRTMINWNNKKDRLPTRGNMYTRGGRRREKIPKKPQKDIAVSSGDHILVSV
jgi:hypothetical protein